jgi:L-lactate dehydrogenase complex protein LldG
MTTRQTFLERVRQAVAEGNRAGAAAAPPARGDLGYQGCGQDPSGRFAHELIAAGGVLHAASDAAAAQRIVHGLVQSHGARNVLVGRGAVIDRLELDPLLGEEGRRVVVVDSDQASRHAFFAADLGISGVAFLIAETGSVVAASSPAEPRSLTLLPPVHIAVAGRSQILPDLFDLFEQFTVESLPSCLTIISGPSKTGDIELRLVTGVHGPGELHVVLIESL